MHRHEQAVRDHNLSQDIRYSPNEELIFIFTQQKTESTMSVVNYPKTEKSRKLQLNFPHNV